MVKLLRREGITMEEQPKGETQFFKFGRIKLNPEDFARVKRLFPILRELSEENKHFRSLVYLLKEMWVGGVYDSTRKYELTYNIIKIVNYIELLTKEIEIENPGERLAGCGDNIYFSAITPHQQKSVFLIAKNVAADCFHLLYEKEMAEFLDAFSAICRGICKPVLLRRLLKAGNDGTKGPAMKPYLSNLDDGEKRVNKLMCQIGYFLMKAQYFSEKGDFEKTCMALLAAGTCARDFNRSTLNPVKVGSVMAFLTDVRAVLSHFFERGYDLDKLQAFVGKTNIQELIVQLTKEASDAENELDLEAYYNERETSEVADDESPRAYEIGRINFRANEGGK